MANLQEFMFINVLNDLEEAEILQDAIQRIFHSRDDPFVHLSDSQFRRTYRLSKGMVVQLIDLVEPFLRQQTRGSAVDVTTKVLTTLNFLAYGSYQLGIGQNIYAAISQSSVSRAIHEVVDALNRPEIFTRYVCFPRNILELQNVRNEFYIKHNFPGVIGCLDCTQVAIYPPKVNDQLYPEHLYINRKGYHSINVQLICDANTTILNVNARFPGSTHDSHIWNNSNVRQLVENLHNNGHSSFWLLSSDSGYALRPYLITPITEVQPNTPEARFNTAQKATRSLIERCNGILKLRFRCLLKHRVLHYTPTTASKIINACVVLHNMCIANGIPDVPPENGDENLDFGMYHLANNVDVAVANGNEGYSET